MRIIALDGIGGDYDVLAEQGNLSIVLPQDADAIVLVTAQNGLVYSALPMTGGIEKGLQKFQTRLSSGAFRVALETREGNVVID